MGGILIPELPAMPPAATEYLKDCLGRANCFLEYGAGGSTRLAARMNVPAIYSIESDAKFMAAVEESVRNQGSTRSRMQLLVQDIGPTGDWGYPLDTRSANRWPDYVLSAWDALKLNGDSPDLILIDGRFRPACFFAALLNAKAGTTIILDDYVGREEDYGIVMDYAPLLRFVDRMAVFVRDGEIDTRRVSVELARYCVRPA